MGCCGQKRDKASTLRTGSQAGIEASRHWSAPSASPAAGYSADRHGAGSTERIQYVEAVPVVVQGAASGRQYVFSSADSVQLVDRRDAEALLRTRYFRRA